MEDWDRTSLHPKGTLESRWNNRHPPTFHGCTERHEGVPIMDNRQPLELPTLQMYQNRCGHIQKYNLWFKVCEGYLLVASPPRNIEAVWFIIPFRTLLNAMMDLCSHEDGSNNPAPTCMLNKMTRYDKNNSDSLQFKGPTTAWLDDPCSMTLPAAPV